MLNTNNSVSLRKINLGGQRFTVANILATGQLLWPPDDAPKSNWSPGQYTFLLTEFNSVCSSRVLLLGNRSFAMLSVSFLSCNFSLVLMMILNIIFHFSERFSFSNPQPILENFSLYIIISNIAKSLSHCTPLISLLFSLKFATE